MEAQVGISLLPQCLRFFLQGKKLQEAEVIFQISGRFPADVVIDGVRRLLLRNAEGGKRPVHVFPSCAVIMNGQIQQTVKIDLKLPFQPEDLHQKLLCPGSPVFRQHVGGIAVGKAFHIIGPALHIASEGKHGAHRLRVLGSLIQMVIDGLIQMAGIALHQNTAGSTSPWKKSISE